MRQITVSENCFITVWQRWLFWLQVRLGRRYRAQMGAPTLVLLEGATGRLITSSGCERLNEDPTGAHFPWTPRALTEVLREAGPYLSGGKRKLSSEGEVRFSQLEGLVKGIYFSAHWVSSKLYKQGLEIIT